MVYLTLVDFLLDDKRINFVVAEKYSDSIFLQTLLLSLLLLLLLLLLLSLLLLLLIYHWQNNTQISAEFTQLINVN